MTPLRQNVGYPLTNLLHNGSVQVGTGVSCMGCRRGSTGFSATRPLRCPLGLAAGAGDFFAIRTGVPWLLPQQSGPIPKGPNLGIGAVLAAFTGNNQPRKLLDSRTTLESHVPNSWPQFELLMVEAYRCRGFAVEQTGLRGADSGMVLILSDEGYRAPARLNRWKRQQRCVNAAREMYRLFAHYSISGTQLVCDLICIKRTEQLTQLLSAAAEVLGSPNRVVMLARLTDWQMGETLGSAPNSPPRHKNIIHHCMCKELSSFRCQCLGERPCMTQL